MPGATVAHECWRWLVWNRAPFYIDQLCISPPYTVYADPEQKQAENQRISKLNASAYVGATHGILGIPPGGRGEWTMVELRILGKRAARLPDDFGDASALLGLGLGYIVHGDTYWEPPPVKWSGRLKSDPDYSHIAMQQVVEDQKMTPSERLPEEKKVLDELLVQIGKPLGPTAEEVERIRQFPDRDYSETVRKYEALLSLLKDRMSETSAPVDKTPHPTIEQAKSPIQLPEHPDASINHLVDSLQPPAETSQSSDAQVKGLPSPPPQEERPVFYRRFAGSQVEPRECDVDDRRINGRLDRLYCHDASPYAYRGPFEVVEDEREIEKWILEIQIPHFEHDILQRLRSLDSKKARLDELKGVPVT